MDRPAVNLSPVDQVRLLGAGLEPLPGTRLEVEAIERALRGADADVLVLTGSDAQAGNLYRDAIDKRFLHLATHGYAGSFEQPDAGALALAAPPAGSSTDNGFLTLDDLVRTWRGRLTNCELVVLSACETQKGADRGDAVMALPWGFMYAGAPSVVASLWKVDDRATALLMPRFYENIVGQYEDSRLGKPPGTSMSKAEGLQEAKIWLVSLGRQTSAQLQARGGMATSHVRPAESDQIVDFSDPYYWAGFVLLGDPD
jgi:CHAT domain-containing protein